VRCYRRGNGEYYCKDKYGSLLTCDLGRLD